MKTLKDFMKGYRQKSDELQSKIDGLEVDDKEDVAGNKDDVFKGSKVKQIDRKGTRHGYDAGDDEKVYEEVELDEKKLTPAEMKKREEVAKAIESGNPNMPMAKKMAIATATAKKVAESSDAYGKSMDTIKKNNITNPDKDKISKLQAMMAAEKKPVKEEADKEDMPFKGPYRKVGDREDEYGNKVKNVAKHLAKKAMKANEEVEGLEELSNKTLGSYIKKASTQAFSKAYASGVQSQRPEDGAASEKNLMKANKRVLGIHNASDRMTKEEVEDLGEQAELDESAKIAAHLIKRYGDNVRKSHVASAAKDFGVDPSKLAKAVRGKLNVTSLKEDEQIDEISATTKDSYAKKAVKQLPGLFNKSGETADDARKYYNRKNTVRKIANEEAEGLDEISSDMADRYLKGKRERDWKRSDDDSYSIPRRPQSTRRKNIDARGTSLALKTIQRNKWYTKEEADILDEISSKKLTDYMDKASDAHGHHNLPTKKVDNRYAGVKKASDKLAKEEVEQVDELSKELLGRYSAYSYNNYLKRSKDRFPGEPETDAMKKRKKGWELSNKKQDMKEAEQVDEISKATMGSYINKAKDSIDTASYRQGHKEAHGSSSRPLEKKLTKRHKGISMAVDKLTKEDAEQIDELSKATMGSYVKKASGAEQPKNVMSPKNVPLTKIAAYQGDSETGHFGKRFNQATYDKAERLRKNRETGIKTAVNKLTKEDIINRTIEKYVAEDYELPTLTDKFVGRISTLSEGQVDTLVAVFESLNEHNQIRMIDLAETKEGLNSLLNFALDMRYE